MDECFIPKPYAKSRPIEVEHVREQGLRIYKESPFSAQIQIRTSTGKQGRVTGLNLSKTECEQAASHLLKIAVALSVEGKDSTSTLGTLIDGIWTSLDTTLSLLDSLIARADLRDYELETADDLRDKLMDARKVDSNYRAT